MEKFLLVEVEKHEIDMGLVGYLRWLRGDNARKLSEKVQWDVGRVVAISWFLRAAFL